MSRVTPPLDAGAEIDSRMLIMLPDGQQHKCINHLEVGWYGVEIKRPSSQPNEAEFDLHWTPVMTCGAHSVV